jgi:hypothetical protein
MTTIVTSVYTIEQLNFGININKLLNDIARPPLPTDFLYSIGVLVGSDTSAVVGTSVVRTIVLATVPSADATATAARDESSGAGPITSITVTSPGMDYATIPVVLLTDATASILPSERAKAVATLQLGQVIATDGGGGYAAPVVTIVGGLVPGGVPAEVTATVALGVITGFTIVNPGGPYVKKPSVVITDSAGVGATGDAQLEVGGIELLYGGVGYETPIVTIVGLFKYTYPDGLSNQAQPFVGMIRHAIEVDAASPLIETPPVAS